MFSSSSIVLALVFVVGHLLTIAGLGYIAWRLIESQQYHLEAQRKESEERDKEHREIQINLLRNTLIARSQPPFIVKQVDGRVSVQERSFAVDTYNWTRGNSWNTNGTNN